MVEHLIVDTVKRTQDTVKDTLFSIILVHTHFNFRREDNISIKDKLAAPNVSTITVGSAWCSG